MEYLVHWKGYAEAYHTWKPKDNLGNAKAALDLFYERNSQKPPDDVHWEYQAFLERLSHLTPIY